MISPGNVKRKIDLAGENPKGPVISFPEGGIEMRKQRGLLWAALLLVLLWRLLFPAAALALRDWAEAALWPRGGETVAAWGRALGEEEERIPALLPGAGP